MMMAGAAQKLIKSFNKTDIPTQLFVIFTTGGIDFVGGHTYHNFLKAFTTHKAEYKCLGKVNWPRKVEKRCMMQCL